MKVILTVYIDSNQEKTFIEKMKLSMDIATGFAQMIEDKNLKEVKGFDVFDDYEYDTNKPQSRTGLPFAMLKKTLASKPE